MIVDPKYAHKIIGNAPIGESIHAHTKVSIITNVMLQDWTSNVKANQNKKNNQGLKFQNIVKSISDTNTSPSFIKERAKKIRPRLRQSLLIIAILFRREKKLNPIAHKKIKGKAKLATLKLNPITHKIEVGIIVQTFAHRITANADVSERTHVHTKASTKTETIFELCNIVVIKTQLPNDFEFDDVNFFKTLLNQLVEELAIACSK